MMLDMKLDDRIHDLIGMELLESEARRGELSVEASLGGVEVTVTLLRRFWNMARLCRQNQSADTEKESHWESGW